MSFTAIPRDILELIISMMRLPTYSVFRCIGTRYNAICDAMVRTAEGFAEIEDDGSLFLYVSPRPSVCLCPQEPIFDQHPTIGQLREQDRSGPCLFLTTARRFEYIMCFHVYFLRLNVCQYMVPQRGMSVSVLVLISKYDNPTVSQSCEDATPFMRCDDWDVPCRPRALMIDEGNNRIEMPRDYDHLTLTNVMRRDSWCGSSHYIFDVTVVYPDGSSAVLRPGQRTVIVRCIRHRHGVVFDYLDEDFGGWIRYE